MLAAVLLAPAARAQSVAEIDPHVRVEPSPTTPGRLRLRWTPTPNATGYTVFRRDQGGAWQQVASLSALGSSWEDPLTTPGQVTEYRVRRNDAQSTVGNAYVLAGFEVPYRDELGEALVVVDEVSAATPTLAEKLSRFEADLEGDGWRTQRAVVASTATPPEVKARIAEAHSQSGGRLRAVVLLGEVPRAFSGKLNPDGHPDHEGAWPADAYYADLVGSWTDAMNLGGATAFANTGGDGKFDPSVLPASLQLAVGRVDTADLPAFAPLTAQDLLARYLDANHAYRHGLTAIPRRTLVTDTFGYFGGEAFARVAWRDGMAVFGEGPVASSAFFDSLEADGGYTLAFGCGGGWPQGANGVGSTTDFVNRAPRAAFMGLFGSYFGDWSYSDNFLRASLVSPGATLGAAWFARPSLHLHHLGALRSFGEAFLASANNNGFEYDSGFSPRGVHQALLGDPTLRLFVTRPPGALSATSIDGRIDLSWAPSPDATDGYHVYRRSTGDGALEERMTVSRLSEPSWSDLDLTPGASYRYRVVAVQKLTTGSGTFFNHSQGALTVATAAGVVQLDAGSPMADAGALVEVDAGAASDAGLGENGSGGGADGCGCASSETSSVPAGALVLLLALSLRGYRSPQRSFSRRMAK